MTDFITTEDLGSYPGVTITDTAEADLVVDLTNGLITDVVGASLDPVPTRVRAIAFEVAARALRNPEGYTSRSTKIDDFTDTVRHENQDAVRAGVYLTDDELADLLAVVQGPARVTSIPMRIPGYDRRYAR